MTKTELAQMYLPELTPAMARQQLNRWIRKNESLHRELRATGWEISTILLTPAQIKLIEKHVGEP